MQNNSLNVYIGSFEKVPQDCSLQDALKGGKCNNHINWPNT